MTALVIPAAEHLTDYVAALEQGWSPNNLRPEAAGEQLKKIAADPKSFLDGLQDPHGAGAPVMLPDGSRVPRLPSLRRWIWADGFCGTIGLRWTPGTADMPPTASGHIGYAIVPHRRREGHATAALRAILPLARAVGLPHLDITTDANNHASIGVMKGAGAIFVKRYQKHPALGVGDEVLYRIDLSSKAED
ncbi:MAG: GNAT family N-acetyltransferase [Pseudomonadota bacterium]